MGEVKTEQFNTFWNGIEKIKELEDEEREDVFRRAHGKQDTGTFLLEDINILSSRTFKRPTKLPRPPPLDKTVEEIEMKETRDDDEDKQESIGEDSEKAIERVHIEYEDEDRHEAKNKATEDNDQEEGFELKALVTPSDALDSQAVEAGQTEISEQEHELADEALDSLQPHENDAQNGMNLTEAGVKNGENVEHQTTSEHIVETPEKGQEVGIVTSLIQEKKLPPIEEPESEQRLEKILP